MELILEDMRREPPDVIIMNSCMWDISRYGPKSEEEYYENMNTLCTRMRETLPPTSTFLWLTTLPMSSHIASGFLLESIRFLSDTLRVAVLEANYYVAQIITAYGFDILDLHFYMRTLINHREKDGVHWDACAHRHITDMICVFLYDSWGIQLPDSTIEEMKKTNLQLDCRHFSYEGYPNFVEAGTRRLEELALPGDGVDGTTSRNSNSDSGIENQDPEEIEIADDSSDSMTP